VWADATGGAFRAELDPENPLAVALHSAIKRGVITGTSFAFHCNADKYSDMGDGKQLRTLTSIDLNGGDVSPVVHPASGSTTLVARSGDRACTVFIPDYTTRAAQALIVMQRKYGIKPRSRPRRATPPAPDAKRDYAAEVAEMKARVKR
jgi:phage head maturation protease